MRTIRSHRSREFRATVALTGTFRAFTLTAMTTKAKLHAIEQLELHVSRLELLLDLHEVVRATRHEMGHEGVTDDTMPPRDRQREN